MKRLASLEELHSERFRAFMAQINGFARLHDLRIHTNWSKIWEYPWTWQYLRELPFPRLRILDIGSELSPMPWFFASLGANVTIVETDPAHVHRWQVLREKNGLDVRWELISGPELPMASETYDLVTSYSVIEHIRNKETAIEEAIRVLKTSGMLCLTFDICEESRGMSFPEWNGQALDMESFDQLVWRRGDLEPLHPAARWNEEDIGSFLEWHRKSASHHNYVVGAALLRKKGIPIRSRTPGPVLVHQLDTGLGAGNTGDDAMFIAAVEHLPADFSLTTEVHSQARTKTLPLGVRYISMDNRSAAEASIREAQIVLIMGGTPVMDEWGLEWPLLANARKLEICHSIGKPVHAVGVGIDRLKTEGERIFRKFYAPLASWSVRSEPCRRALLEMGVPEERIHVGADWAWLLNFKIDREWAAKWLSLCGVSDRKLNIGVNAVNEIWGGNPERKKAWATLLDRLIIKHDARICFFCNESRPGEYFDRTAAEEIRSFMNQPSLLLPDRYYLPSEAISLIASMDVTISQRYHFTLFSALAGVYPISIQRGQKMAALNRELELPFVGDMEYFDGEAIEWLVDEAFTEPSPMLQKLGGLRSRLESRAATNFSMLGTIAGLS
ncbi:MAG: Methyltransferase type 11 [Acidobacteria bacterium]|nr:Methyltransferase type 11 [Acidobacteriota bacterium]